MGSRATNSQALRDKLKHGLDLLAGHRGGIDRVAWADDGHEVVHAILRNIHLTRIEPHDTLFQIRNTLPPLFLCELCASPFSWVLWSVLGFCGIGEVDYGERLVGTIVSAS